MVVNLYNSSDGQSQKELIPWDTNLSNWTLAKSNSSIYFR